MARFYSNENIARQTVVELRRLGHDVLTSAEAGNANTAISDASVLAFSAASGRILLTHNRLHFLRLHRNRTAEHCGIVLCTVDPDFVRQARRIDAAVSAEPDLTNRLIRVNQQD